MSDLTEQEKSLDQELLFEQIRQLVLDFFYSYFVDRDIDKALVNVSDDVVWEGPMTTNEEKDFKGCREMLQQELETLPKNCQIKVIHVHVNSLGDTAFCVQGALQLRIPFHTQLVYDELHFITNVCEKDSHFFICNMHNTIKENGFTDVSIEKTVNAVGPGEKANADIKDSLTGFFVLDSFKDVVRKHLRKAPKEEQYALFCTDITNFEKLNNLYGLQKADRVLMELSKILSEFSDRVVYCCRSVADHFIVYLRVDSEDSAREDASEICRQFDKEIPARFPEAKIRLGVGAYMIMRRDIKVGIMIEHVNIARKSLKLPGSERVSFYDPMALSQVERIKKIEKSMQDALKNGEFHVYLQPKYHLRARRIVGAEALIRWIRPDGSRVFPDDFIPVFEKNGFIQQIDFYVLEEVCRFFKRRLRQRKKCIPVSVNQSRVLLTSADYTEHVASVLKKYKTPPQLIELELTERLFTDKLGDMAEMMNRLKKIGVKWSIDDFGTGYSSLNLLKELPVDVIKIDKSFLDETETSEVSRVIIRKTVELTRELEKLVVCEGVETEAQASYLRTIKCDVAQGYLYAKPMPMDEFEALLDAQYERESHKSRDLDEKNT